MQELVVESLMVPLAMVVFYVLVDETTQMPLAERDHACETLLFDRPDEPLGERHLRCLVREYVEHYHRERNHQGLDNQLLQRPPPPVRTDADVRRRERLGGLLNFYYREAT